MRGRKGRGGAGQGKSKDIRMWHPFHDSDHERGKRDPERVIKDSDRGLLGPERAIREIGRGSIALFHSSSLFRPLALLISSHFLISSEPIPLVPPLCAALIRGIYYIIIKSRHTASKSCEVLTRFSCRQKCLLRISIHYILL